MSDVLSGKGSCLCGSVTLSTETMAKTIGACHCSMCRNWGGGPLMTVDCGNNVAFSGEEFISTFSSSDWAERGFCKNCGTHLFYRIKENALHIIPAGLLNEAPSLEFDHQVFVDEKPQNYAFSNQTKDMTGAEVFAMFGASE